MAKSAKAQYEAIKAALSTLEPQVLNAFLNAMQDWVDNADYTALYAAIQAQNVTAAVDALHLDKAALTKMQQALGAAYQVGGELSAAALPALAQGASGARMVVRFDGTNDVAMRVLQQYQAALSKDIVDAQVYAVRDVLTAGFNEGSNPRSLANKIVGTMNKKTGSREGGIIGLTDYHVTIVNNAERQLREGTPASLRAYLGRELRDKRFDRTVMRAINSGTPLPKETVDKMAAAYRSRMLKHRAEVLSANETMSAMASGTEESHRQLVENGVFQPQQIRSTWRTASDSRVRHSHSTMEGQTVGYGEPFVTGAGVKMRHPHDPSAPASERIGCRCYVTQRIEFNVNTPPGPDPVPGPVLPPIEDVV